MSGTEDDRDALLHKLLAEQERQKMENKRLMDAFEQQRRETEALRQKLELTSVSVPSTPSKSTNAKRFRNRSSVNPREISNAMEKIRRESHPTQLAKETNTLSAPTSQANRNPVSEPVTDAKPQKAPKSTRKNTRRSMSEISAREVKAALDSRTRRPHPFLDTASPRSTRKSLDKSKTGGNQTLLQRGRTTLNQYPKRDHPKIKASPTTSRRALTTQTKVVAAAKTKDGVGRKKKVLPQLPNQQSTITGHMSPRKPPTVISARSTPKARDGVTKKNNNTNNNNKSSSTKNINNSVSGRDYRDDNNDNNDNDIEPSSYSDADMAYDDDDPIDDSTVTTPPPPTSTTAANNNTSTTTIDEVLPSSESESPELHAMGVFQRSNTQILNGGIVDDDDDDEEEDDDDHHHHECGRSVQHRDVVDVGDDDGDDDEATPAWDGAFDEDDDDEGNSAATQLPTIATTTPSITPSTTATTTPSTIPPPSTTTIPPVGNATQHNDGTDDGAFDFESSHGKRLSVLSPDSIRETQLDALRKKRASRTSNVEAHNNTSTTTTTTTDATDSTVLTSPTTTIPLTSTSTSTANYSSGGGGDADQDFVPGAQIQRLRQHRSATFTIPKKKPATNGSDSATKSQLELLRARKQSRQSSDDIQPPTTTTTTTITPTITVPTTPTPTTPLSLTSDTTSDSGGSRAAKLARAKRLLKAREQDSGAR